MTPVEQIAAALDLLGTESLDGLSLRDEILEIGRLRARLDAEEARRLRAFDVSCEWSVDGSRSAAAFLIRHTRCASGEAHSRIKVARQVGALDATAAAWANGDITTKHVEVIARARHAAKADEQFAEFEPALLKVAESGTPEDVSGAAGQWRDALDADLDRDGSNRDEQQQERRSFDFSRSIDGMGFGRMTLDPLATESTDTELQSVCDELRVANDPRTPTQLRADALVEIFRRSAESRSSRANLPHVLAIVDEATLNGDTVGECRLASGARISPDTARRLACDAMIQRVLRGENGVPLALGRATRTFTNDQFRYFVVRDAHCRGPGCTVNPKHCEGHHLDEWERDDGPTDVDNGFLVCRGYCHRMLHEGGWTVRGNPNRTLDFYNRNGKHVGSSAPAPRPTPIVTAQGKKRARIDRCIRRRADALRSVMRAEVSQPR